MSTKRSWNRFFRIICSVFLLVLLVSEPAVAFKPGYHQAMTQGALGSIQKTVAGQTYQFTDKAISEIATANVGEDKCATCQFQSEIHFDDEDFDGGSQRLIDLKNQVLKDLSGSSPDGKTARKDLGKLLHTLQDFFAHSSRIELGLTGYDSQLGVFTFGSLGPTVQTCPSDPATLGGAVLTGLTSGYFPLPSPCNTGIPTGKCRHGNDETFHVFDTCDGINKDSPTSSSHGRVYFQQAYDAAYNETVSFVTNLILGDSSITNNAKAVRALMGVTTTLGMVVDTTGSMSDVIGQVQAQITSIVNSVAGTTNEPDQYLLETFNDPYWGAPLTTDDAGTFLNAVNGLTASGGGDCPELAMDGLLAAVKTAHPQSTLYLFSDASAKDSNLAPLVNSVAVPKKIKIKYGLEGSCSPIDPGYISTAAATGGQVFFVNRDEAGSLFSLVSSDLGQTPVTIAHQNGTTPAGGAQLQFPADSLLTSLTISASIDSFSSMVLTAPDGTTVTPLNPNASFTNLSTGQIISINAPEVGTWAVSLQGSGSYSVDVSAKSAQETRSQLPSFTNFQFVTLTGRIGHSGYFPISGQPFQLDAQTVLGTMSGATSNVSLSFMSQDGNPLQPLTLSQSDPYAAAGDYVGSVSLPSTPFRVLASGIDKNGSAFQRIYPTLFQSQAVEVMPASFPAGLPQGQSLVLSYQVWNAGPSTTYNLSATDSLGFISSISPSSLTLNQGASGTFSVTLSVPTSADLSSLDSIAVLATSSADSTINNSAVQEFPILTAFSYNGGGQNPNRVNPFLSYANPTSASTTLQPGTYSFPLMIEYGPTTIPSTFAASLNGADVTSLFHPAPGTFETVKLTLQVGKNTVDLSISGTDSSGHTSEDKDRLTITTQ